ncbi:MAG: DHH family phosphoesterase [Bariatricus sp.]|nr:DHH family phosphoesterase [Bariatricus sp.]
MGFLSQFLHYDSICIQCHNNPDPDALASALGLYTYFTEHGINVKIVYGGKQKIKKKDLLYMMEICEIPAEHIEVLPETSLLMMVDAQFGQGNAQKFDTSEIAAVDHHMPFMEKNEKTFIDNTYQSCSTIVWELLKDEGYSVVDNRKLRIAFLYGLYTDTSSYVDLYKEKDCAMRAELRDDYPELERLTKSCMTLGDLMIAGDALHNCYFDTERRYLIISAMQCDQSILGIIGDMAIKVDAAKVTVAFTDIDNGYQISVRSCDWQYPANIVAKKLCENIGNGGGHRDKAGGNIVRELMIKKYSETEILDVIIERMNEILYV